jgi:hypothetical protein
MANVRMKIHQIMQTRRPLYEPVGACEPHITGTSRTAVIAACRAHIRASDGAPFTALLAHPSCGCTVIIPVTKSAIRKQWWSRDIADVLDTGTVCGNCYRAAADRVEAGRREVMQCLRAFVRSYQCLAWHDGGEPALLRCTVASDGTTPWALPVGSSMDLVRASSWIAVGSEPQRQTRLDHLRRRERSWVQVD